MFETPLPKYSKESGAVGAVKWCGRFSATVVVGVTKKAFPTMSS